MEQSIEKVVDILLDSNMTIALTGAGISVESGIPDFRSAGGLWSKFDPAEYATIDAFRANPQKVWEMLREMDSIVSSAKPNKAHLGMGELEHMGLLHHIITQNVDNLHERAGSKNILHLHGMLTHVRSTGDPELVYDIGYKEVNLGDKCEKGFQLRPHIVWFGEAVPAIEEAAFVTMSIGWLRSWSPP